MGMRQATPQQKTRNVVSTDSPRDDSDVDASCDGGGSDPGHKGADSGSDNRVDMGVRQNPPHLVRQKG